MFHYWCWQHNFLLKCWKTWNNKAFVGRYDLLNGRFLQHLPNKHLHLNVSSMMSAAQFSSKMLKDLKEQRFCRKVWLTQKQLSKDFSCKDKLCSFCELPAWWKTSQTPLLTKIRDFESTETSKIWNLRSQILLSLWAPRIVKIYSKTSFDKIEGGWTLCSFKNLKMQTLLIFSLAPLVKTIKIHLLTKVRARTKRKLRKWS